MFNSRLQLKYIRESRERFNQTKWVINCLILLYSQVSDVNWDYLLIADEQISKEVR